MEETLLLKDLNCANCAAKIEDRIRKMDVVETANFTLATHQLKLTGSWEDREALKRDIQDICDAIEEGVTVADYERKSKATMDDHGHDHDHGSDAVTIAVIVAGLLFCFMKFCHPLSHPSACQRVLRLQFTMLRIFFLRSQYCVSQVVIS